MFEDHGLCVFVSGSHSKKVICPNLKLNNTVSTRRPGPVSGQGALTDGFHWALEAGRRLQLQLVGHGVDLKPIQSGEKTERRH